MEFLLNLLLAKERFNTSKGPLTLEQLGDLSIEELDKLAVALDSEYEQSPTKSFIKSPGRKNARIKEKLDAVLAIMNRKIEVKERADKKRANKEARDRIMAELDRRNNDVESKSTAALKKDLDKLGSEEEEE